MFTLATIPWRLIGFGLVAAAVLWAGVKFFAWVGDTLDRASKYETAVAAQHEAEDRHSAYVARVAQEAAEAARVRALDEKADTQLALRLETLASENEDLRRHAARVPATVEKANAKGVTVASINPAWWLCQSAALSGSAADAAACEAGASAGAVSAR